MQVTQFIYPQDVDIFSQVAKAENSNMLRWKKESIVIKRLLFNASKKPKLPSLQIQNPILISVVFVCFVIRTCVNPDTEDYKTLHLHPTVGMRMRRV